MRVLLVAWLCWVAGRCWSKRAECSDRAGLRYQGLGCEDVRRWGLCLKAPLTANGCRASCGLCSEGREGRALGGAELRRLRVRRRRPAARAFRGCCEAVGVSAQCAALCRFSTTPMDLLAAAAPCARSVAPLMSCATRRVDSSACCRALRVPDSCLDAFCDGQTPFPKLDLSMALCLAHTQKILACHLQHHAPFPPPSSTAPASDLPQ